MRHPPRPAFVVPGTRGRNQERKGPRDSGSTVLIIGEALRDYGAQRGTTGWLFVGESGKPLSDRNLIQRHVYPVAQSLGIPHFSWHSLRHTFSHAGRKRGESSYSGDETTARTFKAEHHRSRYMHDSQVRSVRPCRKSKT